MESTGQATATVSVKAGQVGVPATYSLKITRGTTGRYGFEIEVHNAATGAIAIRDVKRMRTELLAAMPELTVTGG